MAGHDVEIDAPIFVPLDIELHVCASAQVLRDACTRRACRDWRNACAAERFIALQAAAERFVVAT